VRTIAWIPIRRRLWRLQGCVLRSDAFGLFGRLLVLHRQEQLLLLARRYLSLLARKAEGARQPPWHVPCTWHVPRTRPTRAMGTWAAVASCRHIITFRTQLILFLGFPY
jgi:hypothetical protein